MDWRQRVKHLLKKRRITQEAIAIAIGVTPAFFGRVLSGRAELDLENLRTMARELGVTLSYLLDGGMLTDEYVRDGMKLAQMTSVFERPLTDLSYDELLAVAAKALTRLTMTEDQCQMVLGLQADAP